MLTGAYSEKRECIVKKVMMTVTCVDAETERFGNSVAWMHGVVKRSPACRTALTLTIQALTDRWCSVKFSPEHTALASSLPHF
jgi:hypothetical protein